MPVPYALFRLIKLYQSITSVSAADVAFQSIVEILDSLLRVNSSPHVMAMEGNLLFHHAFRKDGLNEVSMLMQRAADRYSQACQLDSSIVDSILTYRNQLELVGLVNLSKRVGPLFEQKLCSQFSNITQIVLDYSNNVK
jgi:hypothetical protein